MAGWDKQFWCFVVGLVVKRILYRPDVTKIIEKKKGAHTQTYPHTQRERERERYIYKHNSRYVCFSIYIYIYIYIYMD